MSYQFNVWRSTNCEYNLKITRLPFVVCIFRLQQTTEVNWSWQIWQTELDCLKVIKIHFKKYKTERCSAEIWFSAFFLLKSCFSTTFVTSRYIQNRTKGWYSSGRGWWNCKLNSFKIFNWVGLKSFSSSESEWIKEFPINHRLEGICSLIVRAINQLPSANSQCWQTTSKI